MPAWGVFVYESRHDADFRMEMSRYRYLVLFYILKGRTTYLTDRRSLRLSAGNVLIIPAQQPYRIEDDPQAPVTLYGVCIDAERWKHDLDLLPPLPVERPLANKLLSQQVRSTFRQLLFEQTVARPAHAAILKGITLQLLGLLARADAVRVQPERSPVPAGNLIDSVRDYVQRLERSLYEDLNIDQAAGELGMSRRRFTELFRQTTGATWKHYLHRQRIDHAKRLLRSTDRSIASVAFECGFDDLSTFYRVFKSSENQSPNAWRTPKEGRRK